MFCHSKCSLGLRLLKSVNFGYDALYERNECDVPHKKITEFNFTCIFAKNVVLTVSFFQVTLCSHWSYNAYVASNGGFASCDLNNSHILSLNKLNKS